MDPPDEPLKTFSLACSKAQYALLRTLYDGPATPKDLATARSVSQSAISQQLGPLSEAGLVRAGTTSSAGTNYVLTVEGRSVFEAISGLSSARSDIAWFVTATVGGADPTEVRRAFSEFGGETLECAGDADYISFLPRENHELAIALAARLREYGAVSLRALVLTPDDLSSPSENAL